MIYKGLGLALLVLMFSGCASQEEPRWALLGDTDEKTFFIDRLQVERLTNGNYRYPVKSRRYQKEQPHTKDDSHDTNEDLFIEMNCREKQWTKLWNGFMNQDDKVPFRQFNQAPVPLPIKPDTIHFSAYNYLCGEKTIFVQHNH
jgi:hypothetical protein